MRQKQSHSDNHGKGAASAEKPLTKTEAKEAMAKFESLTRRLLAVTREQVKEELARHEKRKHAKKPIK